MAVNVENYTWDYRTRNEIPGVKITTEDNGRKPFVFIPDAELYDVAVALADIIDGKNKNV